MYNEIKKIKIEGVEIKRRSGRWLVTEKNITKVMRTTEFENFVGKQLLSGKKVEVL